MTISGYNEQVTIFVNNKDPLGLKKYLDLKSTQLEQINPEIFKAAFTAFVSATTAQELATANKILEVLSEQFYDKNLHQKYMIADKFQNIDGVFKLHKKLLSGEKVSLEDQLAIQGLEGITFSKLKEKVDLLQQKGNKKEVERKLSDVIKVELLEPISKSISKEKTRLEKLNKAGEEFLKVLPNVFDKIEDEIFSNAEFKKKYTQVELSNLAYDMLVKAGIENFGLDKEVIDAALLKNNTEMLDKILGNFDPRKHSTDDITGFTSEIIPELAKIIPQHLIDIEGITKFINELADLEIEGKQDGIDSCFSVLSELTRNIVSNIEFCEQVGGKNEVIEASLLALKKMYPFSFTLNSDAKELLEGTRIKLNAKDLGFEDSFLFEVYIDPNTMDLSDSIDRTISELSEHIELYGLSKDKVSNNIIKAIKAYNNEQIAKLETVQKLINESYLTEHVNLKRKPISALTKFEERAILKFEKSKEDGVSSEDKKLLQNFFKLIASDKEFGSRVHRMWKDEKNQFTFKHRDSLSPLVVYHEQVSKIDHILKLLDENDKKPNTNINPEVRNEINKFLEISNVVEKIEELELQKDNPEVRKVLSAFYRAKALISTEKEIKTIDLAKISELVESSNFEGLSNYLAENYKDTGTIIPLKTLQKAFEQFIDSDGSNITKTRKTIEVLRDYIYEANNIARYKSNGDYIDVLEQLNFKAQNKESAKFKEYNEKLKAYNEHQTNRKLYKYLDSKIEENLTYKILYPENTSFIRRLLRIPPKKPAVDVINEFRQKVPELVENIRAEIRSSSNFTISETDLNQIIYERLLLKAGKQLHLSRYTVDGILTELNRSEIEADSYLLVNTNDKGDYLVELVKDFTKSLNLTTPPHLFKVDATSLTAIAEKTKDNKEAIDILNSALMKKFDLMVDLFDHYSEKPNSEIILVDIASSIEAYINVLTKSGIDTSFIPEEIKTALAQIKEKAEVKINENALKANNKVIKPRNSLTEYEVRGIALIDRMKTESLSDANNKFIGDFISYAEGNKNFNARLGKALKTENDFILKYKNTAELMHSFSFKGGNIDKINKILDKLEFILSKEDGYEFKKNEKLSLSEIGDLLKFTGISDIIEKINQYSLTSFSEDTKILLNTYNRANELIARLDSRLEDSYKDVDSDVVVEVASSFHRAGKHRFHFKTFIQDHIFTSYSHAAVVARSTEMEKVEEGKEKRVKPESNYVFEIVNNLVKRKEIALTLNAVISERFKIFPDKLIQSNEDREKLCKALGVSDEKLHDKLHEMYKKAATNVTNKLFDPSEEAAGEKKVLVNNEQKRQQAGFADFIPLAHTGTENIREWAISTISDQEIAEAMKGVYKKEDQPNGKNTTEEQSNKKKFVEHLKGKNKKSDETKKDKESDNLMICSEFTARIIVLSLVQLEKDIAKEMKKENPKYEIPANGLFKLPFDLYEDLGKVHPERLVKKLQKVNAIEKVDDPKFVQSAIAMR